MKMLTTVTVLKQTDLIAEELAHVKQESRLRLSGSGGKKRGGIKK
jgi:hypothetical protein